MRNTIDAVEVSARNPCNVGAIFLLSCFCGFDRTKKVADNWGTDAELSKWDGIKVDKDGRVVELSLFSTGLTGIHRRTARVHVALEMLDLLKKLF